MKLLLIGLFLSLPFGQLTRLELNGIAIYLHDFFLLLICLTSLKNISSKSLSFPLVKPILIFLAALFLSLVFTLPNKLLHHQFSEWLIGSLYFFRVLLLFSLFPSLLIWQQTLKRKFFVSRALLFSGLTILSLGLLQYFLIPDTRFLFYSGWDDHYYRLIGTFFDPNFTGLFLTLFFFFLIDPSTKTYLKPLWLFLTVFGLLLTFSRSSYLAWVISLIIFIICQKSSKLILILALSFIILFFIPKPGGQGVNLFRLYSFNQRLETANQALILARHQPLFGVGFNLLRFAKRDLNFAPDWSTSHSAAGIDNSFLFVLATSGIVGLFTLIWFSWETLKLAFHRSASLFAATTALLIHSQFNNSLFYPFILIWYLTFLAKTITRNN